MAEHPILEAMARAVAGTVAGDDDLEDLPNTAGMYREAALAALRKLAEAEPTPGMRKAFHDAHERWLSEEGTDDELMMAPLRALLEEVEAAHG